MMRLGLVVLSVFAADVAQAEPWTCTFTTSCLAGLDCEPFDLSARVIAADHEGQLFLELGGEPLLADRVADDRTYIAHGPEQVALLSIGVDGAAWLSRHDFFAGTLFGHCERVGS